MQIPIHIKVSAGIFTAFLIASGLAGHIKTAEAQTPCYSYSPSSAPTYAVTLTASNGQQQTLTLPAQNPPSLLQQMDFYPSSPNCALWYNDWAREIPYWISYFHRPPVVDYTNSRDIAASFVTSAGDLPFSGSPFRFTTNNPSFINSGYYGYLSPMTYKGASDIGSNEDTIIDSVNTTHSLTIKAGGPINAGVISSMDSTLGADGAYGVSATMSAAATNCVTLSNTGVSKIVFMRGSSWNGNIGDFVSVIKDVVASISGGKTPIPTSGIDYSIDLKKWRENAAPTYAALSTQSSCGVSGVAYILLSTTPNSDSFTTVNGVNASVYIKSDNTQVIVMGVGILDNSKIFDWVDAIQPSTHIISSVSKLFSPAYNTKLLAQNINSALANGKNVIVVGHCIGSLLAYNIHENYAGKNVQFVYLDPPYGNGLVVGPLYRGTTYVLGIYKPVRYALDNHIENSVDTVNWTNGKGIVSMRAHDPFDFPNYLSNAQHLKDLKYLIQQRIIQGNKTSSSAGVSVTNLSPSPTIKINGLQSTSGTPISSVNPGDTVTLSGSGFDPQANLIEIRNIANPNIFYDLYDYPADASGNLTFTLPQYYDMSQADGAPDTVEGAYSIQVASYSSDWSNAGSVTILNTGSSLPPAPTSIVPYSATPNTWVLNGTGFKATNDIQLTPSSGAAFIPEDSHTASAFDAFMKVLKNLFFKTASAQTTSSGYIIPGVSGNSTSVTFEVPVSVPNGTYTVSVRSTNTAWANTSYKITVTGHGGAGSGTTPGTTPVTTPTPPPPVQTGPSFPATISYSCASGYTLTGTSCYKPAYTVTTPAGFTNPWQPQAFGPYSCAANPLFSIPAGATLGAKAGYTNGVCYYPAVTTTVPASTISAAQYSCPSGYLLGGTTCNIINTVAITPPSPGAVTAGGANINYICPAGTGSLSTDSSGNPTCQKPMTVSGGSCPGGYGPHFSATQDGAPCYSLSATTLIQGNYFSKPTTTYTCADGTSLSGTICVSGVGAFSASNLSSAATSALCPVGYTLQSNNTCLWPGVRAVTSASYTKNSDGNLFQDPRFDFGNGQVAIAADATTAKKWCQTLDTIDTSLKFSDGNVVSNSSITGTAASFDGTKWKVVSNAKYAASLKCTGSGGPSAGVTNAVSFCATGYKTVSGTCVSTTPIATPPSTPPVITPPTTPSVPTTPPTTPPGTTTGTVPATIKYTCSSGSLSGNSCISTTTNGTGIDPKITHTCPTGYRLRTSTNTQCRASNGFNVNTASTSASFIPSTPLYSCKTGYTLNTADKRCYLPSKIKTTPAIPSYICPSGYILNTTAKTCSPVVAIKKANIASLSTSTANVWDGLENWIGWVVWIAK